MKPNKAAKIIDTLSTNKGLENMASVMEVITNDEGEKERFSHTGFNQLPEGAEPGSTVVITTRQKASLRERITGNVANEQGDLPGIRTALANMGFLAEPGSTNTSDPSAPQLEVGMQDGKPAVSVSIEDGQRVTNVAFTDRNPHA